MADDAFGQEVGDMTTTTPPWPAPSMEAPPPPPPPVPQRRRSRWLWVVAGVFGVVALVAVGVATLVGFDSTALRHDLITADFERGPAPFETGSLADYRASWEDGEYVLTATADPRGKTVSYAAFTRTAYNVTVEVLLGDVDDAYRDNWFGVACLDRSNESALGYEFVVSRFEVALMNVGPDGVTEMVSGDAIGEWPPSGARLMISCAPSLVGDSVTVTGSIDGEEVITAIDETGVGVFRSAALFFGAHDQGDDIHIDVVSARVPGG